MKTYTLNASLLAILFIAWTTKVALAIHSNDAFDDTGFNFNFDDEKSFFKRASSYQNNQRGDGTGFNVRIDHKNGNNNNNMNEQGAKPTEMTVTSSTQSSNYLNNGQRIRHNAPNSNGARFYSGSNRLNIQRPIGSITPMNHQASNVAAGPAQSRGNNNYHTNNGNSNGNSNSNSNNNNNNNNNNNHRPNGHNERRFFGNSDIHTENWGDLPPESSNTPAKTQAPASPNSYANDPHNVDQVQLPSGVPHPSSDPRAQFIKERVGHENSEGKPFGSKLKYTFRDPKAPNNYMEVTEVRMSMNRQYNDNGNNNGGGNNGGHNGGGQNYGGPAPAPPVGPPPMPPMGPGHFASHASAPDGFIHSNFDPFSSSSSADEFGDFGPNGPDFNFDSPAEPVEPMAPSGPSASPSQNHVKCNHPSHRQESQHRPITGPSLGPNSNAFTDLSSFFHSPAQSSPSLVRSVPSHHFSSGPGDHSLESFFTDSFLDDPFVF